MFHSWSSLAAVVAVLSLSGVATAEDESRIAAISGVHTPHQGFALSATVPSDKLCLELAQNLSSELGIVVHVVCTNPISGTTTIVAECGYAQSRSAERVASYSGGWAGSGDQFLICVPPDSKRFEATRVAPEVERLRRLTSRSVDQPE